MPSFSTMYAIFAVMVVVLPVPARISWGPEMCLMASSWWGLRVERREFKEIGTTVIFFDQMNAFKIIILAYHAFPFPCPNKVN